MEVVKQEKPQQALQTIRVLIADDDPPTRILLRAAIAQWGYSVVEAGDGEQAWQILQEADAPQLVILDWIMPKLDGPSLCERIKQELSYSPYIILLTQVSGTTNIIKGLEAGADEFLSKPFNMAELRSRLSVGARIINYKNELENQNKKTAEFTLQAKKITNAISTSAQEITTLANSQNKEELQGHLSTLQTQLQKLNELIETSNLNKQM